MQFAESAKLTPSSFTIASFAEAYELIFIEARKQADAISIVIAFTVLRQTMFYTYRVANLFDICSQNEQNLDNFFEILVFNFILFLLTLVPIFLQRATSKARYLSPPYLDSNPSQPFSKSISY